ncbi:MAG: hypothetical protein EOM59_14965 [Clostridia bacterium]|nr:hypothetical protein [Clostridia bacterium]
MKSHKSWNTRPKLSEEKVAVKIDSAIERFCQYLAWDWRNANVGRPKELKEKCVKESAKAICNADNLWEE